MIFRRYLVLLGLSTMLIAQSLTQPGGNPGRKRGFVPSLRFTIQYRSLQPETVTVPEGAYDIEINSGVVQSAVGIPARRAGKG